MLRKAYNMYEKLFKEVKKLHERVQKQQQQQLTKSSPEKQQQQSSTQQQQPPQPSPQQNSAPPEVSQLPETNGVADTDATADNHTDSTPESIKPVPRVDSDNFLFEVDLTDKELSTEASERLYGAVCFGFGCLQLAISLVPPKILKIIEFLGFDGDREHGLKCIETSSRCEDMKSPLAA